MNKIVKIVWRINDAISDTDKTSRIWADTRGNATAIERIVFLMGINPFEKIAKNSIVQPIDFKFMEKGTKYFIG